MPVRSPSCKTPEARRPPDPPHAAAPRLPAFSGQGAGRCWRLCRWRPISAYANVASADRRSHAAREVSPRASSTLASSPAGKRTENAGPISGRPGARSSAICSPVIRSMSASVYSQAISHATAWSSRMNSYRSREPCQSDQELSTHPTHDRATRDELVPGGAGRRVLGEHEVRVGPATDEAGNRMAV